MTTETAVASTVPVFLGAGGLALGAVAVVWGATPAGNTALAVPFIGGPALLAAGWVVQALALRHGNVSRAGLAGGALAAVALGAVLAFIPVVAPAFVIGSGGTGTDIPMLALALSAPVLAVLFGGLLAAWLGGSVTRSGWIGGAAVGFLALAATLLPGGVGYFLIPLVIPLALAMPLMVGRGAGRTGWVGMLAAGVATAVALVIGLVLGGQMAALYLVAGPGLA